MCVCMYVAVIHLASQEIYQLSNEKSPLEPEPADQQTYTNYGTIFFWVILFDQWFCPIIGQELVAIWSSHKNTS